MSGKGMSLKARIRNLAREKNVPAQALLQTWVFQRFLSRLEKSAHKDRFVLKGGVLVAVWVGVDRRTTMDMDVTVRGMPLTDTRVLSVIRAIGSINAHDDVSFSVLKTEPIRDDDIYGGAPCIFVCKLRCHGHSLFDRRDDERLHHARTVPVQRSVSS